MNIVISAVVGIFLDIICFGLMYEIMGFNVESAFLFSLFIAIFTYKRFEKFIESKKDSKKLIFLNLLYECNTALFCVIFFYSKDLNLYILCCIIALIFIRIYNFFKPSVIGRFYNFALSLESSNIKNAFFTNKALNFVISAILNAILCAISTLLCLKILEMFDFNYHNFSIIPT